MADLNRIYRSQPALNEIDFRPEGFEWIDCNDSENGSIAFMRRGQEPEEFLVVCCNFTPVVRHGYQIGVPQLGWYEEIFNSDSTYYAGSDVGNGPGIAAKRRPMHGREFSLELTLPPLATTIFKLSL